MAGNDGAEFAEFVREHSRSLFGTAYLLTGSADIAEELLQATLVDLYPRWARVAAATSPQAYARRALVNRFLTSRRERRVRVDPVWELPETALDSDLADTVSARVSDRALLWRLLGDLPARQRAALVLRYFHDQDDGTIARSLGCRAVTVRSLISRGLARMRELHGSAPLPVAERGGSDG